MKEMLDACMKEMYGCKLQGEEGQRLERPDIASEEMMELQLGDDELWPMSASMGDDELWPMSAFR